MDRKYEEELDKLSDLNASLITLKYASRNLEKSEFADFISIEGDKVRTALFALDFSLEHLNNLLEEYIEVKTTDIYWDDED